LRFLRFLLYLRCEMQQFFGRFKLYSLLRGLGVRHGQISAQIQVRMNISKMSI
jgi:hypothetical protein